MRVHIKIITVIEIIFIRKAHMYHLNYSLKCWPINKREKSFCQTMKIFSRVLLLKFFLFSRYREIFPNSLLFKSTQSLTSSCFSFGRKTHMRSIVLLYKYCHYKGKKFSAVRIRLLILTNNLWQRQSLRSITMAFVTCITYVSSELSPKIKQLNCEQLLSNQS